MPLYLPFPVRSRPRTRWLRRALPALLAIAMGLVAFQLGANGDARTGISSAGVIAQFYAVLTLFVLGGFDLGLPTGPTWIARSLLWGAYFLAPAVTTITLIEAFFESLRPGWWQRRRLKGHVVVVGAGRLGMLYLEALRAEEPKAPVLVVDREPGREAVARHFGAAFFLGDIRWKTTRTELSLHRARGVILMTKDDLRNLTTATDIVEEVPHLAGKIVAHVGDLGLQRTLSQGQSAAVDGAASPSDVSGPHLFNSHRVAAQHLVERKLRTHFAQTEATDVVVLAGFGRFNQTILEILQVEAKGEFHAAVIVDAVADVQARSFDEQVGFGDYRVDVIKGDMNDPAIWDQVHEACSGVASPAYVLGTDDDSTNLRAALGVHKHDPEARIFTRCFAESSFTERLAETAGFEVSAIAALVEDSLREQHRVWFGGGRG